MTELNLITRTQAAELLGVTSQTLRRWEMENRGPRFFRISEKSVRYDLKEVERWIASKQVDPESNGAECA